MSRSTAAKQGCPGSGGPKHAQSCLVPHCVRCPALSCLECLQGRRGALPAVCWVLQADRCALGRGGEAGSGAPALALGFAARLTPACSARLGCGCGCAPVPQSWSCESPRQGTGVCRERACWRVGLPHACTWALAASSKQRPRAAACCHRPHGHGELLPAAVRGSGSPARRPLPCFSLGSGAVELEARRSLRQALMKCHTKMIL